MLIEEHHDSHSIQVSSGFVDFDLNRALGVQSCKLSIDPQKITN